MNNTDVVTRVSQITGIDTNICQKILKAFEDQAGDALIGKFQGKKNNRADMITAITARTGFALEDCDKVLTAFEEVFDAGLSDKMKFFK